MDIRIKRIDTSLPLPEYKTDGSVAFDIYAREDAVVEAQSLGRIPTNLIIATPPGYGLVLSARSSLASKKGLWLANGIGVIDQDYAGDGDEILLSVYNFSTTQVSVERGERIAQGMFVRIDTASWIEVEQMDKKSRGGFGSTGK
ncbi:MAG: dUTP diphosphatase [Candidatus Magasanikbacteria bacterium CG11_big_fil_rev_8_21_14_0_20_43_7]|uniref:dUTP diphosphatase n=1 Tax=Candidatus Magasanikbacteria bacterium CG11_big_fil_rev_8_21_14_0_20_43_7 TaxID=1974654 RepID=A0A2H0N3D8_9BACT|nr:MAG: dUTP diphosphatase [Candidatus Magasanikbacteria bacterium CG11_big_fil_rev_8_21_14_0_20_43_7]